MKKKKKKNKLGQCYKLGTSIIHCIMLMPTGLKHCVRRFQLGAQPQGAPTASLQV